MKPIYPLLLVFAVSGCASQKVIIDKEGVDMSKYEQDLESCKQYAEEVETGAEVGKGAGGGAVIGGAVGAILGGRRYGRKISRCRRRNRCGSWWWQRRQTKNQVIKNCLRGRGYRVLKLKPSLFYWLNGCYATPMVLFSFSSSLWVCGCCNSKLRYLIYAGPLCSSYSVCSAFLSPYPMVSPYPLAAHFSPHHFFNTGRLQWIFLCRMDCATASCR